jgi:transcriptional regulator with XRE-family HTH domain
MSDKLLQQFGLRVRALRAERGWSQEELGFETELDRTYVSGIERGVRNPTLSVLGRLANGLNVSLSELVADVDKSTARKQR